MFCIIQTDGAQYPRSSYCQKKYTDDICERFYHHRDFLIKSMLEGQEGLEWKESPVLRHFKSKFPVCLQPACDQSYAPVLIHFQEDFAILNDIVMEAPKGTIETQPEDGPRYERVYQVEVKSSEPQRARRETMVADLSEEEDDDMDSGSSHQRKSILRPRSSKASKKFMSRHRNSLSLKEEWLYQGNDSEDLDGNEEHDCMVVPPATGIKNGITNGTTNRYADKDSPKTSEWSNSTGGPLPSYYEPQGDGENWTCPYDGCMHKVWAARESSSLDMIKDHFVETHAGNAEDLIYQESRPWVSVE